MESSHVTSCTLLATGRTPARTQPHIAQTHAALVPSVEPLSPEQRAALAARIKTLSAEERKTLAADRRRRVDACLAEQQQRTGKRATRTAIWRRGLRYETAKDFQQWQRADPLTTKQASERIERYLRGFGV
jgi:hypothetical protein